MDKPINPKSSAMVGTMIVTTVVCYQLALYTRELGRREVQGNLALLTSIIATELHEKAITLTCEISFHTEATTELHAGSPFTDLKKSSLPTRHKK
jgi:hypothetical protein